MRVVGEKGELDAQVLKVAQKTQPLGELHDLLPRSHVATVAAV